MTPALFGEDAEREARINAAVEAQVEAWRPFHEAISRRYLELLASAVLDAQEKAGLVERAPDTGDGKEWIQKTRLCLELAPEERARRVNALLPSEHALMTQVLQDLGLIEAAS
jgi:hypothetical protein